MNVSSVKNLNGEVFSAVQDVTLTDVVQSNSAQCGQGGGNCFPMTGTDGTTNYTANANFSVVQAL